MAALRTFWHFSVDSKVPFYWFYETVSLSRLIHRLNRVTKTCMPLWSRTLKKAFTLFCLRTVQLCQLNSAMCSTWRTRQVLKQCDCWYKRATEKTSENFDFFLSLSLDRYRQYVMCVTVQCKVFNQDQGNLQHRRQIISPVACWIVCR